MKSDSLGGILGYLEIKNRRKCVFMRRGGIINFYILIYRIWGIIGNDINMICILIIYILSINY